MTRAGNADIKNSENSRPQSARGDTLQPLKLTEPYQFRQISSLGVLEVDEWRFKLYGIHAPGRPAPDDGWKPTVWELAQTRLEDTRGHPERYGVGFIIVHHGREADFVLIDWWVGENMLENHVHVFPSDGSGTHEYMVDSGLAACVWELSVMSFEREAWIETVLANSSNPDLEAYLKRQLEGRF
ncbi:hypothetical protein BH24ACT22_BH24ACT22_18090 [soil metagenome]